MKIVTYNIHKGMNIKNKNTLNKMIKYLKELDCDVICLQEVLYNQFAKIKVDLNMDGVFAPNINKPNLMYGICTFSKREIDNHSHVLLTSKKEQRGFLYTNVFSNCGKFNVINTHLGLDYEERKTQVSEILDYVNTLNGKNVICGDMNEKNISINTFNDLAVYTKKYNLITLEKYKARIDYIFTDKLITIDSYGVDCINHSDHYPVIGDIK